jgi:hypothetical protein
MATMAAQVITFIESPQVKKVTYCNEKLKQLRFSRSGPASFACLSLKEVSPRPKRYDLAKYGFKFVTYLQVYSRIVVTNLKDPGEAIGEETYGGCLASIYAYL